MYQHIHGTCSDGVSVSVVLTIANVVMEDVQEGSSSGYIACCIFLPTTGRCYVDDTCTDFQQDLVEFIHNHAPELHKCAYSSQ